MFAQRELRQNIAVFARYLLVVLAFTAVYSVLFHLLMLREGRDHSWLTGLYWTLTVMTTLGFGDITFHSDMGRGFSILVLLTGVVLLLIVLPFAFIKNFYAPWIEAQLKVRVPRELPPETRGHVIICELDALAHAVIKRLAVRRVPYVLLVPDPVRASQLHGDGFTVMVGEPESVEAWRGARVENAALVVANLTDAANTNVTITLREVARETPVVAMLEDRDAVDILELAGANQVIALKHRLGQHLANRVVAGKVCAHVVGRYEGLIIAELPLRGTPLVGKTLRQMRLREETGLTMVAFWARGRIHAASADVTLEADTVAVLAGTDAQVAQLDALLESSPRNDRSVIVIGGGKVGCAVIRALVERGVPVTVIEEEPSLAPMLHGIASRVIIGDAAALDVMREAGVEAAPSVVLTARDDGVNIFLAVYARRLNPSCHIVSRINHERNLEAIHRAGADTVISESVLGAQLIVSFLFHRDVVLIGETIDLHAVPVPANMAGKTVAEADIGARTGLTLIAIRHQGHTGGSPQSSAVLPAGATLVMIGTTEQRKKFEDAARS